MYQNEQVKISLKLKIKRKDKKKEHKFSRAKTLFRIYFEFWDLVLNYFKSIIFRHRGTFLFLFIFPLRIVPFTFTKYSLLNNSVKGRPTKPQDNKIDKQIYTRAHKQKDWKEQHKRTRSKWPSFCIFLSGYPKIIDLCNTPSHENG